MREVPSRLFYWMLNTNTLDFTKDVRAMPKDLQQVPLNPKPET
jgi:hypothetical protein